MLGGALDLTASDIHLGQASQARSCRTGACEAQIAANHTVMWKALWESVVLSLQRPGV